MPSFLGMKFPLPTSNEKFVFSTAYNTVAANSTVYIIHERKQGEFAGNSDPSEAVVNVNLIVLRAGVMRNLVAHSSVAPGAGNSFVYTVRVNQVPTALTCTISGAVALDANDLINTAEVVAGDRVTIQLVTSLAAAVTGHSADIQINFPTTRIPFEGIVYSGGSTTIAAGVTRYLCSAYMRGGGGDLSTLNDPCVIYLCVRKGSLKTLVALAGAPPGVGQTFIYMVMVNGVASTLTATIGGAAAVTAMDATDVVQIDPGDRVVLRVVSSGGAAVTVHAAALDFEEGDYRAG